MASAHEANKAPTIGRYRGNTWRFISAVVLILINTFANMPLSESRIQQDCVRWFKNTYCLRHHQPRCLIMSIPNEAKPHLTATGLYPGGADLLVMWPAAIGGCPETAFFEVKTDVGKQSPKQIDFEQHVKGLGGRYFLVRSFEEFMAAVRGLGIADPA